MFSLTRISALAGKGGATVFIAAFVVALAAVSKADAGESGAWTVASAEGAVTMDGEAVGSPGATIGQDAVIETGADGNMVLTRPGDSITVFPNSKLSVPAGDNGDESGILQTLGKLLFRMESRESRDFKIETPYLAAAIKGTTFTVEVDDGDAVVAVSEGSVLVTANRSGQSAYVGPGERAGVAGGGSDAVRVSRVGDDEGEDGEKSPVDEEIKAVEADEPEERVASEGGGSHDSPGSPDSSDSLGSADPREGKDSPADHDSGKGNDDK